MKNNLKPTSAKPLISVVLPVYNAGKYLSEALDSLLGQTVKNFEIIAVNDGSSDNSLEILNDYAKKDSRLKVFSNEKNSGVSKTANRAISLASGRYIARMDADDVIVADRFSRQLRFLRKNPEYILVGGQVVLMDANGAQLDNKNFPTDHETIYAMMYSACPVQQATIMIDSAKLPQDFVWYEDGMNTAEEVELMFKLLNYGKFANIPQTVYFYRQHPLSLSHKDPKDTFRLTYIARKKGVSLHGYKPSLKDVVTVELQKFAVIVLPKKWVYPVYYISRSTILLLSKLFKKNGENANANTGLILNKTLQPAS